MLKKNNYPLGKLPYFVNKKEVRHYRVKGVKLDIAAGPGVFPPPRDNPISAENLVVHRGESVIDIGTGSGILAILAAKFGGRVVATDIDEKSIKLAKENAKLNSVEVNFARGEYFSSFTGKLDVIVANLAQTILPTKLRPSEDPVYKSVDGGPSGNEVVLGLLKRAKGHMKEKSRLYVNVFTLSDYEETIKKMEEDYEVKKIATKREPVKEFVEENIEWYKHLAEEKKIKLIFDATENRWFAEQYFYELRLRQ